MKNVFGTNWLPLRYQLLRLPGTPYQRGKNYHTGVDIGMAQGTEILAGHDGTVTMAGKRGRLRPVCRH